MAENTAEVTSHLVRRRNALAMFGDFRPILRELELHLLACDLTYDPFVRQLLGDGLSALGLHLASRPLNEFVGWTVSLQSPLMNLFFTADVKAGTVVGRAFLEGVEPRAENLFVSQVTSGHGGSQRSNITIHGIDIFGMVEHYYAQSEQRLARFLHRGSRACLILSLPEADVEWIAALDRERAFRLPDSSHVKLLARREVTLRCGCDRGKIAAVLVGIYGETPEALFGRDSEVEVHCPRCGARMTVTREDYDRARRASSGPR